MEQTVFQKFDVRRRARQDGERSLPKGQPPQNGVRRRSVGATFDVERHCDVRSALLTPCLHIFNAINPSNQTSNVERRTSNVERRTSNRES